MPKHASSPVLSLVVSVLVLVSCPPVILAGDAEDRAAHVAALDALAKQLEGARANPDQVASYKPLYQKAGRLKNQKVREPLCFTIALGMLYCGKDAIYQKQRKSLKSLFPRSRFHEVIAPGSFRKPCGDCAGKGEGEVPCTMCKGSGKCPNAKCLDGKITYRDSKGDITKNCPVCHSKMTCPTCDGKGKVKQVCLACGGRGGASSRTLLRERLLALVDASLAAVRSQSDQIIQEARFGEVRGTGKHVTPPELKERLAAFGQWMLMQQRRLDMKIVSKVSAKFAKGDAVLCLVMTPNFTEQDYDWRLTIAKSCFKDWRTKCGRSEGKQYYPGMLLLDDSDAKVGEFIPAESRIWLPK